MAKIWNQVFCLLRIIHSWMGPVWVQCKCCNGKIVSFVQRNHSSTNRISVQFGYFLDNNIVRCKYYFGFLGIFRNSAVPIFFQSLLFDVARKIWGHLYSLFSRSCIGSYKKVSEFVWITEKRTW